MQYTKEELSAILEKHRKPIAFLALFEVGPYSIQDVQIPFNVAHVLEELKAKHPDVYAALYKSTLEFNAKSYIASHEYDLHTAKFTNDDEIYAIWVKKPTCNRAESALAESSD